MGGNALLALLTMIAVGAITVVAHRARRARAGLVRLEADLDRCQRLLAQSDRLSAIGMLAASVAHEIRNPLVSVRTFAQLLPERLHDEEFCTSFRELALAEIDRISLLVNDLLAFARPSAPQIHAADINDILDQIRRLVDGETKKRSIEFRVNLDPSLPAIDVEEARIKQIFLNVVLNALHACSAGGAVTLATRAVTRGAGSYFQVEVRDSGPGIPAEDIGRIFDPFFTTKAGGSGLGLFIARRIVQDHGGFIDVQSAPGAGAVFFVNFPLRREALPAADYSAAGTVDADDRAYRSLPHG
jgi:two-component system sensor histidine kinase HydH